MGRFRLSFVTFLCLVLLQVPETVLGQPYNQILPGQSVARNGSTKREAQWAELKDSTGNMLSMVASMNEKEHHEGSSHYGRSEQNHFEWQLELDDKGAYRLYWTVHYADNWIEFALWLRNSSNFRIGKDLFALGFSSDGRLVSSDFCLIWYDLGHRLHLQDARSDAEGRLGLVDDARSVCKLLNQVIDEGKAFSKRERGWDGEAGSDEVLDGPQAVEFAKKGAVEHKEGVEIIFKRKLEVCEDASYYAIDNGTTHLVWFSIEGPLLSIDGLNLNELSASRGRPAVGHPYGHGVDRDGGEPSRALSGGGDSGKEANGEDGSRASAWLPGSFEWGMRRVQLIASKPAGSRRAARRRKQDEARMGELNLDIRLSRFTVPSQETTYWCKLFKLPASFQSRRYHITGFEALVERGLGEQVVHHMELFNCANLSPAQELALASLHESQQGWAGDCKAPDRPKATEPCKKVILAWAMGAKPLEYPELVGQSVGGPNYSPYVVLEVHYNNPGLISGLTDSSGLRFHYTSRLRPYEAGVLEVGLEYTDKNSMPPNMVAPLVGHCVSECTRLAVSQARPAKRDSRHRHHRQLRRAAGEAQEGIMIFAAQMHTHLAGVASWTELIREGKLVGEIQRDNHYSPHFQEIRLLPEPVRVLPGDALLHYCIYDTRSRPNITLGGYATSDEMCVTYLHYYPRVDLEVCKSSVDTRALQAYFWYLAHEEGQNTSGHLLDGGSQRPDQPSSDERQRADDKWAPDEGERERRPAGQVRGAADGRSVAENYRSIKWSRRRSLELLELYANAPLSVQCNRSDGSRWPGTWNGITPSRLQFPPSAPGEQVGRRPAFLGGAQGAAGGPHLAQYRGTGFGRRHARCMAPGAL